MFALESGGGVYDAVGEGCALNDDPPRAAAAAAWAWAMKVAMLPFT